MSTINKEQDEQINITDLISNIAAVKIAEYGRLHSSNLNILTLGPLTNVSLAVLIDSTIRDKVNLFVTGGSYNNLGNSGNAAEYNFRVDPVAAKNVIFYFKNMSLIPLEIEVQITQNIDFQSMSSNDSQYQKIYYYYNMLSKADEEETRVSHSFLGFIASIIVVNPQLIKTKNVRPVDVDIMGRYTRGALAIEKYEHIKSGKFNDVLIYEDLDIEAMKAVLTTIF
jgi:purine nucleosidase